MKLIVSQETCLTPLQPAHSQFLFEILTAHRSHFSRWLPFVNELFRIEQTEKFIQESQALWELKKDFSFAILHLDQARGVISAKELNWISKSTELGYWLDPTLQNQGVMTRALNRLVEFLVQEFGFQTFWIKCAQENLPSQRVAIKAGFEQTGIEKRGEGKIKEVFLIYRRSG